MHIHIVFVTVIVGIIVLHIVLKRSKSNFNDLKEEYINKSKEANSHIVTEEIQLPYVTPDTNEIPMLEFPDSPEFKRIIRKQKTLFSKSKLVMINLPENISNTELKLTYGANNFDKITLYEEHFNGYHRAVLDFAKELINMGSKKEAEKVLEHGINFNSNLSAVYKLLADLYTESSDKNSLELLKEKTENSRLILKEHAVEYIEKSISGLL